MILKTWPDQNDLKWQHCWGGMCRMCILSVDALFERSYPDCKETQPADTCCLVHVPFSQTKNSSANRSGARRVTEKYTAFCFRPNIRWSETHSKCNCVARIDKTFSCVCMSHPHGQVLRKASHAQVCLALFSFLHSAAPSPCKGRVSSDRKLQFAMLKNRKLEWDLVCRLIPDTRRIIKIGRFNWKMRQTMRGTGKLLLSRWASRCWWMCSHCKVLIERCSILSQGGVF